MPVGAVNNCNQGRCAELSQVHAQPVNQGMQSASSVNQSNSPNSTDQHWDWGQILGNILKWTLGIGSAALIGLRALGAVKNHEAAINYVKGRLCKDTASVGHEEFDFRKEKKFTTTLRLDDLIPNINPNEKDSISNKVILGSNRKALTAQDNCFGKVTQDSPSLNLEFDKSSQLQLSSIEVPIFFHLESGFKHLWNYFKPVSRRKASEQILIETSANYLYPTLKTFSKDQI